METETKTDNELIAEFMGWSSCNTEHDTFWNPVEICTVKNWVYHSHNLQFSSSWNWLMPVVEKIAKMDVSFINSGLMAVARHKAVTEMLKTCDIGIVYKAVLEFIKWYNNQKENGNRNS